MLLWSLIFVSAKWINVLTTSHFVSSLSYQVCYLGGEIADMINKNVSEHYENTPIQIYWKSHHQKKTESLDKNSDIFHISVQNIDCGIH